MWEATLTSRCLDYLWVCGNCIVFTLAFSGDKLLVLLTNQPAAFWLQLGLDYWSQWCELQIVKELMKAFDCSNKKTGHVHLHPWGVWGLSRSPSREQWKEVCAGDPEDLGFCFSSLTSCLHLPWYGEIASVPSLSAFIQTTNLNKVIFIFFLKFGIKIFKKADGRGDLGKNFLQSQYGIFSP